MRNRFLSINAQYVHMLRTLPKWYKLEKIGVTEAQWQAHVEKLVENLKNRQLTMVDTSAYLYLYDLITGKRGDRSMRFVLSMKSKITMPFNWLICGITSRRLSSLC